HVATAVANARTLPYSVVVHAYSNLSLAAHLEQPSFEPDASVEIFASLARSGIPLTDHAAVWAEVTRPDGSGTTVTLGKHGEGQWKGSYTTSIPGVYRFRIRARGTTERGEPFTREKTLTAAVWRGGDQTGGGGTTGTTGTGGSGRPRLCELLKCLLASEGALG